jgi:FkbM family methyltransferase
MIYNGYGLFRAVGLSKALEILVRRKLRLRGVVSANVNGQRIDVRPNDSDALVLSQIFGWQEYKIHPARLSALQRVAADWHRVGIRPLVIDAGANVGYSALYFAKLFPDACVLAVEPELASFQLMMHHVRSNPAIRPIHAALWSHDRGVELGISPDGAWASQVGEGIGTPSQRLDQLVASVPNARPLLIKLDIEGAEREVVESCPEIFAQARCIIVEPHDYLSHGAACLWPLYKVAATRKFDTLLQGEHLVMFAVD